MPHIQENESLDLRSEEVQEILSKPPVWIIRWGITIVFIVTCLFLLLTFIIRYPDFVSATVVVTTKQPTERVVVRQTGAIDEILVKDRDTVAPGERLAVIRNTAKTKDIDFLKNILDATDSPSNESFSFPVEATSDLELGEVEAAYVHFEKTYVDHQLLLNLKPYFGKLRTYKKSITELETQLKDQILQNEIQKQAFELKRSDFKRYEQLFEKGIISLQEFENKKIEYLEMQREISAMAISISQLKEAISSANQNFRSTEILKQEDQKRLVTELSLSLSNLKKSIRDWEYNYVLKSSTLGILSFQDFWGSNQYVTSGEVVFSILPVNDTNLMGKLMVPSHSAGKVKIGQKVLIKLNNFPYQQYGMVIGKISNISISPDKDGNYFIYITLPQGTTTSYNLSLPMKQELLGTAEIITEDLSIAERLFYKFRSLFNGQ